MRFFQVSEKELEELRERFTNGQYSIDIEAKTFSMAEYNDMLAGAQCCRVLVPGAAAVRRNACVLLGVAAQSRHRALRADCLVLACPATRNACCLCRHGR